MSPSQCTSPSYCMSPSQCIYEPLLLYEPPHCTSPSIKINTTNMIVMSQSVSMLGATLSSLHGSLLLSLLLFQAEVLFTVYQHIHGGLGPCVPHGAFLIQQAGTDLNAVVAREREGEEELSLEVVLLHHLCLFKTLQPWTLQENMSQGQ